MNDQRNWKAKSRAAKRAENPEGVKEDQRNRKGKSDAAKRALNPEGIKENQRKRKQTSRKEGAIKRFLMETKFGPIFPCVCCHRMLFRETVVEFTPKVQQTILEKSADQVKFICVINSMNL